MNSGIYKIANEITGDFYIGSTNNITRRFGEHKTHLKNNKHPNIILQRACNKYGLETMRFYIVELVNNINNLIIREQYYLDILDPKYNIKKAANSNLGMHHSEDTKEKISRSKAKPFKITSPTGIIISAIGLNRFCREHNLHPSSLSRVILGERKSHAGWTQTL